MIDDKDQSGCFWIIGIILFLMMCDCDAKKNRLDKIEEKLQQIEAREKAKDKP